MQGGPSFVAAYFCLTSIDDPLANRVCFESKIADLNFRTFMDSHGSSFFVLKFLFVSNNTTMRPHHKWSGGQ